MRSDVARTLPRVGLAALPTPLQRAPNLSAELGVEVWLKRDDLSGIGLGGNKVRVLEFLLGEAVEQGCDVFVTGSGPQSNWSFLAALAARRCGLETRLCFYGDPPHQRRGTWRCTASAGPGSHGPVTRTAQAWTGSWRRRPPGCVPPGDAPSCCPAVARPAGEAWDTHSPPLRSPTRPPQTA